MTHSNIERIQMKNYRRYNVQAFANISGKCTTIALHMARV